MNASECWMNVNANSIKVQAVISTVANARKRAFSNIFIKALIIIFNSLQNNTKSEEKKFHFVYFCYSIIVLTQVQPNCICIVNQHFQFYWLNCVFESIFENINFFRLFFISLRKKCTIISILIAICVHAT